MKKFIAATICIGLLLTTTGLAYAEHLGDVATKLTGATDVATTLAYIITYATGTGYTVSSMLKFRKHVENSQQTPLSLPVTELLIAGALFFFPSLAEQGGKYIFTEHAMPEVMRERQVVVAKAPLPTPYPPVVHNNVWAIRPPTTTYYPRTGAGAGAEAETKDELVNILDVYRM